MDLLGGSVKGSLEEVCSNVFKRGECWRITSNVVCGIQIVDADTESKRAKNKLRAWISK